MTDGQARRWRDILLQGGVLAYPTEGVWGLGCLPWHEEAVGRILKLKSRSICKGMILAAGDIRQVDPLLSEITPQQRKELEKTWPGPVTFLVPVNDKVPTWIRGQHTKVAIRVSDHAIIQAICACVDSPIVSTSANPAGEEPALTAAQVQRYFGDQLDLIVPGELGGRAGPSEIRDLETGELLRGG